VTPPPRRVPPGAAIAPPPAESCPVPAKGSGPREGVRARPPPLRPPQRLLPAPPHLSAAPATGTCARPGRLPSAYGAGSSMAIEQNTDGSAPSRSPPPPIGWAARSPNFNPLCHRAARRDGPAHKGRGEGPFPAGAHWCGAGWGGADAPDYNPQEALRLPSHWLARERAERSL